MFSVWCVLFSVTVILPSNLLACSRCRKNSRHRYLRDGYNKMYLRTKDKKNYRLKDLWEAIRCKLKKNANFTRLLEVWNNGQVYIKYDDSQICDCTRIGCDIKCECKDNEAGIKECLKSKESCLRHCVNKDGLTTCECVDKNMKGKALGAKAKADVIFSNGTVIHYSDTPYCKCTKNIDSMSCKCSKECESGSSKTFQGSITCAFVDGTTNSYGSTHSPDSGGGKSTVGFFLIK